MRVLKNSYYYVNKYSVYTYTMCKGGSIGGERASDR
jgi:hypothetical protein